MQPTSDFGPTVWILVAIVAAVLFAIAFSLRKFDFNVEPIEPTFTSSQGIRIEDAGTDVIIRGNTFAPPLQDHTHTTPFE